MRSLLMQIKGAVGNRVLTVMENHGKLCCHGKLSCHGKVMVNEQKNSNQVREGDLPMGGF